MFIDWNDIPYGILARKEVRGVLERIYRESLSDAKVFARAGLSLFLDRILFRKPGEPELRRRMSRLSLPVTMEQGVFAYLAARGIGARNIAEFGTSFGASAIYLAAALHDNGGGLLTGTEIEESKIPVALSNLREAGLDEYVRILPGDALETLRSVEGPVDMLFLDGWKEGYLPLLRMMAPRLRPGAVVLADNVLKFRKYLAPYVAHMQDGRNGFDSCTIPLGDGFEYSVKRTN